MNKIPKLICDVKGFEGLYAITEDYEIWSYAKRHGHHKGKTLKTCINESGYLRVKLSYKNTSKRYFIHRKIAQALIPNPLNLPEINHKDWNPKNNYPSNLEWVDRKQNMAHAYRNNLIPPLKGEKNGSSKLKDIDIPGIRFMLKAGLSQRKIASFYAVTQKVIWYIKHKKTWAHVQ